MEKNLTTGSVFKAILTFALPYLFSYFLQTLYGMADLFIIGQFRGVESTTAGSVGSQVMHMLTVMLVGLAAKNGILIVEFANQRRDAGLSVRDAVLESASTRLRPILMTSIATMAGSMPLIFAGGPGSASRATIGVVVVFGVLVSTLLSLFVVPAFYLWLAGYTRSPDELTRQLEQLEQDVPPLEA